MKYLLLILALVGCTTPVTIIPTFPEAPQSIITPCPALQKVPDDVKLSGVTQTVTTNYTTYYECAVKVDGWIEWYTVQKKIFDGAKQ